MLKGDNRVEDRRETAVDLAGWTTANGLPMLGRMLRAYAVGNYGGVLHVLNECRDLMGDAEARQAAVDTFLKIQLKKQVETTDGREALITTVENLLNVKVDRASITQVPVPVAKADAKNESVV
jgi:hypothetical protein